MEVREVTQGETVLHKCDKTKKERGSEEKVAQLILSRKKKCL